MTFAAEADSCIGGSVLYEDGSLYSLCECGETVYVLTVHMRGMSVTVLSFNRKFDSLVDILNADDGENGHHKLMLNEIVGEVGLADDTSDLLADVYADLSEDNVCITSYAMTAYHLNGLAALGGLLLKHYGDQLLSLLGGNEVCAVLLHLGDQLVCDGIESEYFLFSDAGQVIIEGTAVDNVLTCLLDHTPLTEKKAPRG